MAQSAANGRKAVQLSKSLHRDITTYALAAGAAGVSVLALSPPADAQIVYTPAHEFMGTNQKILIDFDHDGTTDAIIREVSCIDSSVIRANSLQAVPRKQGGGLQLGHYGWAAGALSFGSKIGPPAGFYTRAALMANIVTNLLYYWGSWVFARPSYLGVRFTIRGETHYGWARMGVQYDYRQKYIAVLLSGYAYESEADKPIRAGDTGVNNMEDREPAGEMLLPPPGGTGPPGSLGTLARGAYRLHRCSL